MTLSNASSTHQGGRWTAGIPIGTSRLSVLHAPAIRRFYSASWILRPFSQSSEGSSDRYAGTVIRASFGAERSGIGWLICKIVFGGVGLGYSPGKFGSERILEVVVVGRDASADRGSPMIAAIPGFRKGRGEISVLPVGDHRFDD